MTGVLTGFATLAAVIAVGWLLAQLRIVGEDSQQLLTRVSFLVANPALMIIVMGNADVGTLFSANLVASLGGAVISAVLYLGLALLIWRRRGPELVIGTFSAAYVNLGNLGLPIAADALGDASVVAPMLLVQLLIMQPVGLAVLDAMLARRRARESGERIAPLAGVARTITGTLRNPMLLGTAAGTVLAITGWTLPPMVDAPIRLISGFAVPAMLIAYGVSLRLGPLPGRGEPLGYLGMISALKLVVQPAAAGLIGYLLLDLRGPALLAVTVIAALPTAQNVYLFAMRYRTAVTVARDAIFLNTLGSVPVILGIVSIVSRL